MRASSSSTTEARIGDFRIVRETAREPGAVTYDAIQAGLERRVSLTLLAPGDPRAERFRAALWPEHEGVVSLYAAGATEQGFFIATRAVPGATTLRERIAAGADPAAWLADVRATLAATGAVHGALDDERSLLVGGDGRVLVTGFGLAAPDATASDDERALARLERLADGGHGSRGGVRRLLFGGAGAGGHGSRAGVRRLLLGVAALAVAAAGVAFAVRDRGGAEPVRALAGPLAPAPGAVALGSAVGAGPVRTVDCEGEALGGASLACTAMQATLAGRALVAPRDGVVVAWHVRGARGEVALRLIRRRGRATYVIAGGSDFERADGGLRTFRAAVPVNRGDRFGLELAPGSGAGVRAPVPGATTARFIGGLRYRPPQAPNARGREELLLRVDYVPGGSVVAPERLLGGAAARAPAGRVVEEREIDVAGAGTRTVAAVALPGGVAIDVFDGSRRRARIAVPDADPRGRSLALTPKGEPDLTLRWRNPDGREIETMYRVTASSIETMR